MKNIIKNPVFFFVIIFIILLLLRLPLALVPFFNIDEGIFAAFANSIIKGGLPYRDAVDTLAPLTSYFFSLVFILFGRNNMFAVHLGLIFLILGITVTLYLVGSLFGKRGIGYLAAFLFCIFSYNFYEPDMLAFETEWLLALFSSVGTYFLLKSFIKPKNLFLFLSGLFFALAVFSKQPALLLYAVALVFCCFFYYFTTKDILVTVKAALLNLAGFSAVVAVFLSYYFFNNALNDFWFWFWVYFNKYYVPAVSIWGKIRLAFNFQESYFKMNYLLLILFFFNILITALNTFKAFYKTKNIGRELFIDWYLISWCIFSYIAISYSGRNFGHYYIMALPAICLVAAKTVFYLLGLLNSITEHYGDKYRIPALGKSAIKMLLPVVVALSILDPLELFSDRLRLWGVFTGQLQRRPFIPEELQVLSEYIKKNSREDEKIFVWGFVPELYALTDRLPASRYIYCNYLTGFIPWVNCSRSLDTSYAIVPGAWDIFMREMHKNKPIYIIDTSLANYRCYAKYPPEKFKELASFLEKNYTVETILQIQNGYWKFRLFKRRFP